MQVEVVMPWQGGCPHRAAAREWVVARWGERFPSWPVTVSELDEGDPWCKAKAVMPAVAASTADLVVVADADVWCDGVAAAVETVAAGHARWGMPHGDVRRLNPEATAAVLAGPPGRPLPISSACLTDRPRRGLPGGGLVIIERATALEIPMDPRFIGWGGEDHAWGMALRLLAGRPAREMAPLTHLWHPPQPRLDRVKGSDAEYALRRRYREQIRDRAGMRALLDEIEVTW